MLDPGGGENQRGELVECIGLLCCRLAILEP
jgi:hypothetical protein